MQSHFTEFSTRGRSTPGGTIALCTVINYLASLSSDGKASKKSSLISNVWKMLGTCHVPGKVPEALFIDCFIYPYEVGVKAHSSIL